MCSFVRRQFGTIHYMQRIARIVCVRNDNDHEYIMAELAVVSRCLPLRCLNNNLTHSLYTCTVLGAQLRSCSAIVHSKCPERVLYVAWTPVRPTVR